MNEWELWVGLLSLFVILAATTLNNSLRSLSRVRLAERFGAAGRLSELDRLLALRPQYALATAVLRSLSVFAYFVAVVHYIYPLESALHLTRTLLAFAVAWIPFVIFGVSIPDACARYAGESLIVRSLPILAALRAGLLPLVAVFSALDSLVRRLAGVRPRGANGYAEEVEQEILEAVSEGEKLGAVDEEEKEMIESVIELSDTRVAAIMTPRTEIVALPKDADLAAALETIRTTGYSRIPVYEETIDTVLGILYAKDLLRRSEGAAFELRSAMRSALFIPETKPVRELLREFQGQQVHMAIVLDEYGGTAGLVTIEDILEELVGEISDEYEPSAAAAVQRIDERTVEVDARTRVDDLNEQLDLNLPEDQEFETIGGFVFGSLGRIPTVGEQFEHAGVVFVVLATDPRRILRLRLTLPESPPPGGDAAQVASANGESVPAEARAPSHPAEAPLPPVVPSA